MLQQRPKIFTLTLTAQGTEYPFTVPRAVKKINVQARQSREIRMAVEAGATGVDPYWTLKADNVYYEDCPLEIKDCVLYFQDPSNAGTIIEILAWLEVGA